MSRAVSYILVIIAAQGLLIYVTATIFGKLEFNLASALVWFVAVVITLVNLEMEEKLK